jgi:hypothetical protein
LLAIATLNVASFASPSRAVDRSWNVGTGTWGNAANWSPTGAPTMNDNTSVNYLVNGTHGNVSLTTTGWKVLALRIGQTNEVHFQRNSSLLAYAGVDVGTGSVGYLYLNSAAPGVVFYGSGITSGNDMRLGTEGGFGTVNQNDGTVIVHITLRVGDSQAFDGLTPGTGRYNLSGVGVVDTETLHIGYGRNTSYLCQGEFNLSANATLNAGSFSTAPMIGGNNCTGTLNQSGGSFNSTAAVHVGGATGAGYYNHSGGTFNGPGIVLGDTGVINYTGGANFSVGTLSTVEGKINLSAGGGKTLRTSALITAGGGWKIDLSDNQMVVAVTLGESVASAVERGRNGGAWNGAGGITSSAARDNPLHNSTLSVIAGFEYHSIYGQDALFGGQTVADTDTLVKYTFYGDSDDNGAIDFDDYARIDSGFNNHLAGWIHGDFDSNGVINFDDYALIDQAFNTQNTPLITRAVPEPATVILIVAPLVLAARRRRRPRRS